MWNAIEDNVARYGFRSERLKPAAKTSLWPRIAAAASVIMVMGAALYFFDANQSTVPGVINIAKADINPGGNRAFLTLADGSKISLNDAANGKLANQAGITIIKTKTDNSFTPLQISNLQNLATYAIPLKHREADSIRSTFLMDQRFG